MILTVYCIANKWNEDCICKKECHDTHERQRENSIKINSTKKEKEGETQNNKNTETHNKEEKWREENDMED